MTYVDGYEPYTGEYILPLINLNMLSVLSKAFYAKTTRPPKPLIVEKPKKKKKARVQKPVIEPFKSSIPEQV